MGAGLSNLLAGGQPGLILSQEGMGHKKWLEILMYVHLGVAISKIIVMGLMYGLGDLIQCLILYCGISQHNFCNVFIYMFFVLMLALQLAMPACLALQNGTPLSSAYSSLIKGVNSTFTFIYMMLCLVFYVVAVIVSYRAYREFKYSSHMYRNGQNMQVQNPLNYGTLKD